MKNVFLVVIAIVTLAACGKKDKNATANACQPGVGACQANQTVYPVNSPHAQVGVPGNNGSIVGGWCSINSRIQFDQDGAFTMTRTDGTFRFSRYTYTAGILNIGGTVVPATIAPATAQSSALLYLTFSVGYTEVMEPCDSVAQYPDDQDDKEEPEQESKPHPKPHPKPKPKPQPKPQPKQEPQELPEAPPST